MKEKAGKVQSLILDLLPDLKEVGKDNSVLFCCRESWFLVQWLMTSALCDRVEPPRQILSCAFSQTLIQVYCGYGELGGLQASEKDNADFLCLKDCINIFWSSRLKCWECRCAVMSSIKQNYSMLCSYIRITPNYHFSVTQAMCWQASSTEWMS